MKRIMLIAAALLAPTTLAAQAPTIPNEHASDIAEAKVAAAMARRATRVRGHAVGLDNRPVTPAMRPALAQPGAGPGGRAIPATAATPASPSQKPSDPGAGHGRRP